MTSNPEPWFDVKAITAASAETDRLARNLDITNADHVALWLECNIEDMAGISWLAVQIFEAHEAEIERLRAALQQIVHLDVPRPVAVQYMPDRPSKHDKCAHDVWMYEECGNCISDFATAALSQESAG